MDPYTNFNENPTERLTVCDMDNNGMPRIKFGRYDVSRLISGANTINGYSHINRITSLHMKEYFTPDRISEYLKSCEDNGINTWQSDQMNLEHYKQYREQGGNMHYISLSCDSAEDPGRLERTAGSGAIAIAHHGERTDTFYKSGCFENVREYCKRIRQTGVMTGVSTHMPDAVARILDEGWDVDFFMCCVYERHRSREELKNLLGYVPVPLNEVYLESDPKRMFDVMRQTDKPCLAFKILAAGRLCNKQESVMKAFETTFSQIKPNDAVIVGMYPKYEDQVALNSQYVKKYSCLSGN